MKRIDWLPSLTAHLKNDPLLSECSNYIFAKSSYTGFTEDAQKTPAIWIIPLEATPVKTKIEFQEQCILANQRVMLCVAVRNSRNTIDNISQKKNDSTYDGGLVDASKIEDKLIESVKKWSNNLQLGNSLGINPFYLQELPAADDSFNGTVVLASVWNTKISFK